MNRIRYFVAAVAAVACIPLLAQQNGSATAPNAPVAVQVPTTSAPAGSAAAAADASAANLKPVKGELVSKLDSRNAKTGDSVTLRTEEAVTTADGTEIPKGSKLIGHVALVQPHTKEQQNSKLTLDFDQVQMKSGQNLAIHSVIASLDPPPSAAPDAFGGGGAPMGGGAPSAGGAGAGGRTGGGGAAAGPASNPMPSSPAAADATSQPGAGGNGQVAGKVVAGSGPNAIKTTDIPNVYLSSDASSPASGTLFSAKSNVHLDGGTEIVLDIAPANSR
jgi:hypothetical protein